MEAIARFWDWLAPYLVAGWESKPVRYTVGIIVAAVVLVLMTGCAGDPVIAGRVLDAQIAEASKATLSISCPANGCQIGTLEYRDPRDRGHIKAPTNGYDVAAKLIDKTGDVIGGAVLPIVAGKVLIKGFESAAAGSVTTTSTATTNTASGGSVAGGGTLTATTSTASSGSVAGGGSVTAPVDSHNQDNHAIDDHSAVSEPTVVNPVVVNPVVIQP